MIPPLKHSTPLVAKIVGLTWLDKTGEVQDSDKSRADFSKLTMTRRGRYL
jgi:hypothetical protein